MNIRTITGPHLPGVTHTWENVVLFSVWNMSLVFQYFHQQFLHLEAGDTIDLRVKTISYRKVKYFYEFSVLISFTSSPQECGYNFVHQSASSSLWRLKRRTWSRLIHIKVCNSKILLYILKISWGNWSILCVTNTNYHTKVANAMVMYFSLTLVPLLKITIRIGVT